METTQQPKRGPGRPRSPDPIEPRRVLLPRSHWRALERGRAAISSQTGQWLSPHDLLAWIVADWIAAGTVEKALADRRGRDAGQLLGDVTIAGGEDGNGR